MVRHKIQDDFHVQTVDFFHQIFDIIKRSQLWIYRLKIIHRVRTAETFGLFFLRITLFICLANRINRHYPKHFNTHFLQTRQMRHEGFNRAFFGVLAQIHFINCCIFSPIRGCPRDNGRGFQHRCFYRFRFRRTSDGDK